MPSSKAAALPDPRFALAPDDEFDEAVDAMQKRNKQQRERRDRKGKGRSVDAATKKRKRSPKEAEPEEDEPDLYDEVLNGPLPSTSKSAERAPEGGAQNGDDEEGNSDDEQVDDGANDSDGPLNLLPKPLQLDQLAAYNSKVDQTGLIYLSRIPPGMGPSKVKHILSSYGDIGRIYLVAADAQGSGSSRNGGGGGKASSSTKHRPHRFIEGWVEFLDKKIARHTAELLNARSIGDVSLSRGSKRNGGTKKWKDDVWTMKYLPKFKWNMLSEQVAIEAATRAALLRNEISASKKEQSSYLAQVERAKNHTKAQEKKRARLERRGGNEGAGAEPAEAAAKAKTAPSGKGRNFEQRQAVQQSGKGVDAALGSVLDSLF